MKKLIGSVQEMLIECVGTPLNIDIFYKEADEETIELPYLVYNSQSDMISEFCEQFIFTCEIWGTDESYDALDEASQKIKECMNNKLLIDYCKPLVIRTSFMSRLDVPVEDQRLRCKEVRFKVLYYS
ncbi:MULTISPECIES: hypothetical protein [unclassified Bacillus cereus group]|uniref:hypothetical protein n=1 Tax=unclassified Bacillus cereus group TaxID=2750818 RepID=UPI001F57248B|nr:MULTISPECIES: hypothetical protein [unclassified Bacillus cereus group]